MDATILDTIHGAFMAGLLTGQGALAQVSIALLGVLAVISFYMTLAPMLAMSGGAGMGDALAGTLLTLVKFGIAYWLMANLAPLANAAYLTFFQWGLAPTAGGLSAETFLHPSKVLDVGFRAASALQQFNTSARHWYDWNPFALSGYAIAYWVIVGSFAFVALHLMAIQIEFNLALMVAMVLIPFGVWQPMAFLSEMSIAWLVGGLVRILVTASILGIAIPLFDTAVFRTTPGGDPTFYSAVVVAITALLYGLLAWIIPGRAATMVGRGLGLSGGTILGAAGGVLRLVTGTVGSAIRGGSNLIRR